MDQELKAAVEKFLDRLCAVSPLREKYPWHRDRSRYRYVAGRRFFAIYICGAGLAKIDAGGDMHGIRGNGYYGNIFKWLADPKWKKHILWDGFHAPVICLRPCADCGNTENVQPQYGRMLCARCRGILTRQANAIVRLGGTPRW